MLLKNIWGNNPQEGYFRKQITLKKSPDSAYLRIYVDTGYELFINGRFVAAVDEWCNTRDYNVKVFLKEGTNQLSVHGINHGGHRGVAVELVVDGETVAVSDSSWKSAPYERWGWTDEDFDDSAWDNANELNTWAAGKLQWVTKPGCDPDRIIPTLDCSMFFRGAIPKSNTSPYWNAKEITYTPDKRVTDLLGDEYSTFATTPHLPKVHNYASILDNTAERQGEVYHIAKTERYTGPSFVVDFACQTLGFFRMKIKSDAPVSFRLSYGEQLDEVTYEVSRDRALHRMLNEEYRLFSGEHEFESRMKVGYRFVRVEFFDCAAEVYAEGFSTRTALYPVARKGYFSCDDAEITKLWEMGERTLHYCMQEYIVDAPKRDRFLWTGDCRIENFINYYTFADTKLFEYCWDSLKSVQMPDGGIPASYGEGCSILWDYVAGYILAYQDYYMHTGKLDFLLKNKESIEKATDYLVSLADETGLINVPENPLGKLWMVVLNAYAGYDLYMNQMYLKSLKAAEMIENALGDSASEAKYHNLVASIEDKIANLLADDAITKEFDSTEHLPLQFELADTDVKSGNVSRMVERLRRFFCNMIASGADCLYECTMTEDPYPRIDVHHGKTPDITSFCHAWTAIGTALLPIGIAGITPTVPGFKEVEIKPVFNIFKEFKCAVPTPYGEIAVKYENNRFSYVLPDGVTAKLIIGDCETQLQGSGNVAI